MPEKKLKIKTQGHEISVIAYNNQDDFNSLTDISKQKNTNDPRYIIQNWMRDRNILEFIGLWEQIHNPNLNRVEFNSFKNDSRTNVFTLYPKKLIKSTNAIGIISKVISYWEAYVT